MRMDVIIIERHLNRTSLVLHVYNLSQEMLDFVVWQILKVYFSHDDFKKQVFFVNTIILKKQLLIVNTMILKTIVCLLTRWFLEKQTIVYC